MQWLKRSWKVRENSTDKIFFAFIFVLYTYTGIFYTISGVKYDC